MPKLYKRRATHCAFVGSKGIDTNSITVLVNSSEVEAGIFLDNSLCHIGVSFAGVKG